MCFPLGPKTDLADGNSPPSTHPSNSSLPCLALESANHLGLGGRARVLVRLFATFQVRATWLWHFKPISNRWGLGKLTHSPSRSHSRTHARTHACLSLLAALGQWLATLSVTPPGSSTPAPPPHRPEAVQYPRARRDPESRVCSLPACARRFGSWSWDCQCLCGPGSPGRPPRIPVNFRIPLNFGANFLSHGENYRQGNGANWLEGLQVFNLKGV